MIFGRYVTRMVEWATTRFGSGTQAIPISMMTPAQTKSLLDLMEQHDNRIYRGLEMKASGGRLSYVRQTISEQDWGG